MKFLVQMTETDHFERWSSASPEQREALMGRIEAFAAAVEERGSVVAGEGLDRPATARTLRPGHGPDRPVTEGPYAETAEQLGGFFVVDVEDLDAALDLARLLPEEWTIEVRPVAGPDL